MSDFHFLPQSGIFGCTQHFFLKLLLYLKDLLLKALPLLVLMIVCIPAQHKIHSGADFAPVPLNAVPLNGISCFTTFPMHYRK